MPWADPLVLSALAAALGGVLVKLIDAWVRRRNSALGLEHGARERGSRMEWQVEQMVADVRGIREDMRRLDEHVGTATMHAREGKHAARNVLQQIDAIGRLAVRRGPTSEDMP